MELKVGDKVKVVSHKGFMHGYEVGNIVTYIDDTVCPDGMKLNNFVDHKGLEQVLLPVDYVKVDVEGELIKQCIQFNKDNLTDKYLDERNFKALEHLLTV